LSQVAQSRTSPAPAPRGAAREVWTDAVLRRTLALADVLTFVVVSATLAVVHGEPAAAFWAATFLPAWIVLAKLHGLYDRDQRALRYLTVDELPRLAAWAATGTAALLLFLEATPARPVSIQRGVAIWAVAVAMAFALRSAARFAWRRWTPPGRTLIVGTGAVADATRRKLELFPDIHLEVVAEQADLTLEDLREPERWLAGIDRVILAAHSIDGDLLEELVPACRSARVKLAVVPPVRGMFGTAVQLSHVAELPVIVYGTWDVARSTLLLKRIIDVAFSAVMLAAFAPLLALTAVAIKLDSRGPVLFKQTRVGLDGRRFRMLKFRTMVPNAEALLPQLVAFDRLSEPVFKLTRDPRVTRVGRVLRRTSIDELPQLWNVLRGDMSMVGPRPEEEQIVARYEPEHRVRLQVKPGLTGPMQVNGRGNLRFEERLAVEREYIENLSIARDLRILAVTASTVVTGRGAF
jgi:exopolysaccharide biosynthesis polyprenyl glycosylphosphotransferase